MNKKMFALVLMAVVLAFPFRIAFISQSASFSVNILSFLATVFGFIIFMLLTITDGKESEKVKKQEVEKEIYKQAA